ncbi:MAG: conjugal transfer protein TraF [Gammaproteobacteria bacterium]|nr:conjugal transfer protein TraF [Gammaproteobacteria bacterium]
MKAAIAHRTLNKALAAMLGLAALSAGHNAQALPFRSLDARSAAMGGVGVASGPRYASFNNPALLATADEIHEWYLLAPTLGTMVADPDELEDGLAAFQAAANRLDFAPTQANADAVQTQLDAISDGTLYREANNVAVMIAVPSRILSGAAFLNIYEASTALFSAGENNLSDPANPIYGSQLSQRGVRVVENGFTAAWEREGGSFWSQGVSVGASVKFSIVQGSGYDQSLREADVGLDHSRSVNGSLFALDLGLLKEVGIWKFGLVGKNLISSSFNYGDSGDTFKLNRQIRAGLAYQSRFMVLELDVDLLENDAVGFGQPSQLAAIGWEWRPWRWLALRAGYNQDLVGTKQSTSSGGIGLVISGVNLDVAAYSGEQDTGLAAQAGLQF